MTKASFFSYTFLGRTPTVEQGMSGPDDRNVQGEVAELVEVDGETEKVSPLSSGSGLPRVYALPPREERWLVICVNIAFAVVLLGSFGVMVFYAIERPSEGVPEEMSHAFATTIGWFLNALSSYRETTGASGAFVGR